MVKSKIKNKKSKIKNQKPETSPPRRSLLAGRGNRKIRVGIIGCGTIGGAIAKACQHRLRDKIRLVGICDSDEEKALALKRSLGGRIRISAIDSLIRDADVVVEAASAAASAEILGKVVKRGKDALIMSAGGLLDRHDLLAAAEKKGTKVYIPSGAICGIDGLKSASAGRIDSVTLTTRKPPRGLEGAPYLKTHNIDTARIREETVLFEGTAGEAVKGFPQNVNVAAILSLAGIGAGNTKVRIVTSPDYTKNVHEVEITGSFGRIEAKTENTPSEENPKTSALAVFSAIATLEGIAGSVRIGT